MAYNFKMELYFLLKVVLLYTIVEQYVGKCKLDFKLQVSPKNYFYTYKSLRHPTFVLQVHCDSVSVTIIIKTVCFI